MPLNSIEMKPGYIIAIGGSAGYLSPLIRFFDNTVRDNACYVVLRHIAQNVQSPLNSILKRHSIMEIEEIKDLMQLEVNKVYTLPPGYYAICADSKFILIERGNAPNCAIDIFMSALARLYHEKAIGIILSGSGRNGSEGIRQIKKNGGLVLAQQPGSCEFPNMPENAIRTGCVDKVLLPEEMPRAIRLYEQQIAGRG